MDNRYNSCQIVEVREKESIMSKVMFVDHKVGNYQTHFLRMIRSVG